MKLVKLFFLLLIASHAWGDSGSVDLGLEEVLTQYSSSQIATLDGDVPLEPKRSNSRNEASFVYNVGVTHSTSASPDGTGGYIWEDTNQQTAMIGYSRRYLYEFDLGLNASQTPSENLKTAGPELTISKTLTLDDDSEPQKRENDTSDGNSPTRANRLKLSLTVDLINYTETYDATVPNKKRLLTQVSGTESIVQSSYKLQAKINLGDFRLKGFYSFYRYNRDISSFLNLLSSTRAVAVNASLFSSTLQGFNVDGEGGSLTYNISDDWDLVGQATRYVSVVDGSPSCNYQLTVSYAPSATWRFESAGIHSENELLMDNGGSLNLIYSF